MDIPQYVRNVDLNTNLRHRGIGESMKLGSIVKTLTPRIQLLEQHSALLSHRSNKALQYQTFRVFAPQTAADMTDIKATMAANLTNCMVGGLEIRARCAAKSTRLGKALRFVCVLYGIASCLMLPRKEASYLLYEIVYRCTRALHAEEPTMDI
jgi:hypothetical protein